jgi:hypothetical protein
MEISLSKQTIVGHVKDTAENLFLQLTNKVSNSKYFSLTLEENCNIKDIQITDYSHSKYQQKS